MRELLRWILGGAGGVVLLAALALGLSLVLPGCPVGYVARQSAHYLRVLAARQPVERAIAEGRVSGASLAAIETLRDARRFGVERLGLPAEDLYRTISLARPGPQWIVTACPRDSLTPITWWFPVVGRVAYKGFYSRDRALAQARRLGDVDVLIHPAAAFSTLGWFRDPIRPSMLQGDDQAIASLVLHEAAHRLLYWKGQTDFNESFASFVGDVGAILYLEDRRGPDCDPCRAARSARRDARRFSAFIEEVVELLRSLYAEPISREEKIRRRQDVFSLAKERYLQIPWEGDTYDAFLERRLDNAVILSYRRYDAGQEIFDRLLQRCGDSLVAAMAFVKGLGWPDLPGEERRRVSPLELLERRLQQGAGCPRSS